MKPIIEIKNLNAGYDGRTVLRDVNLTVYDRDFLGIIGPNGGGKTTLIKCILGLLKPLSGEISFTSSHTAGNLQPVSYTHLRAHETGRNLVCRLLLEKKKKENKEKKKYIITD